MQGWSSDMCMKTLASLLVLLLLPGCINSGYLVNWGWDMARRV